eukprot:COSAG03_NODE_848_length_5639_cov_14.719675_2_plen_187_part_00
MGKCSKCSNAQASYYDPDDGPGRYCKQCARDVPNVVSRWQKDKKRKAEARGEGAGAGKKTNAEQGSAAAAPAEETPAKRTASGTEETAELKQRVADLERENKELKEKNKAAADEAAQLKQQIADLQREKEEVQQELAMCDLIMSTAESGGGIEAIITAMRSRGGSAAVQEMGCRAARAARTRDPRS